MATKIDELYISLGLDVDEFDRDFAVADKKVASAVKKLNKDIKLDKMRMDIDMSRFAGAEQSAEALSVKVGHLNKMLEKQKQAVAATNMAHQEAVKKYGDNGNAAKKLEERLLKEQKAQANLEVQIAKTNKAREAMSGARFAKLSAATAKAYDAASLAMAGAAVISVKAATDAVESESLFETSLGSMAQAAREWSVSLRKELGLNEYELRKQVGVLYTMTQSMGLSSEEAYNLSTGMVQLANDMASFYNLTTEEAFTKLKSGLTGEMEPLKALGILVDETTVKQEAYTQGIAKSGAALTQQQKVMARYSTIMRQTSTAQGDLARTMESPANQMRRLRAEFEMLQVELGQKLLPVFQKLMERLQGGVNAFNDLTNAQQGAVMQMIAVGAQIGILNTGLSGMAWALGLPLPSWAKLAVAVGVATKGLSDYIDEQEKLTSAQLANRKVDELNAKIRKTKDGSYEKEVLEPLMPNQIEGYNAPSVKKWVKVSQEENEKIRKQQSEENEEDAKKRIQLQNEEAKEEARLAAQKKATMAANAKDEQTLAAETLKIKKGSLKAELAAIDKKLQEYREKQLDEITITEWAEAQKAKIIEDFTDNTINAMNAAFESGLEVRLQAIEKEKKAWRQKGVDEVQATKWAEEEKRKAIQQVAEDAIKNDRKRLEEIADALKSSTLTYMKDGKMFTEEFSSKSKLEGIQQRWVEEERKKMGIKPGDSFSPELFKTYESMKNKMQGGLIPGLESVGTKILQPAVNLSIDRPVVMNAEALNDMADKVAGVIEPALDKALKTAQNAY